jgi:cytochrome c biogenesis protein CcmG/thiol:disulfide interchange protein DsbE
VETENRGGPHRSIALTVSIALVLLLGMLGIGWLATRDREVAPLPNRRAPEFEATLVGGRSVHLSDYRGKVVLLNIWATWCKPCEEEAPSLERLYQTIKAQKHGRDFEVLAVSIDAESRDAVLPFQSKFSLTFPILFDPEGRVSRLYQTTGVPESFVIDRQGMIREKIIGPREWDRPDTVDWFRNLLAETQTEDVGS